MATKRVSHNFDKAGKVDSIPIIIFTYEIEKGLIIQKNSYHKCHELEMKTLHYFLLSVQTRLLLEC